MYDDNVQATIFETHRAHLRSVAARMLGSTLDADDAVQEAWLRFSGADAQGLADVRSWLTTVVARICLDMLRSRTSRHEDALYEGGVPVIDTPDSRSDPERDLLVADAIGPALLVVLDTLDPAERLAFVLHDLFGVSFDEIAPIVSRTPAAARQLASRARRRVQGTATQATDVARQHEIVGAFLAASRNGDFERLLTLLDPDVVLRADQAAVDSAAARETAGAPPLARVMRGRTAVAKIFAGRARGARLAVIDGNVGAAWAPGGQARAAFDIVIVAGKIVAIEVIANADNLATLDLSFPE